MRNRYSDGQPSTHPKVSAKVKLIRTAAMLALFGNAVLAAMKITAGALFGSGALVGDGIDSSADVLISAMTLVVVRIISRPADAEHPWGHGRAETVATALLSAVLFFAGGQLIWNSIANLLSGVRQDVPKPAALITVLISVAGKILLAWSQYTLGKRSDSSIVKANAKNMAGDVLISLGVLVGLILSTVTGSGLPDTLIAVLIGAWVIKTAVRIFLDANSELMDGSVDAGFYRTVFETVKSVEGAGNPHRVRMRRIAGHWDIDMDIEVSPQLTVAQAHRIAERVEQSVKAKLENIYDIMIHIEPDGSSTDGEGFGLSESQMEPPAK